MQMRSLIVAALAASLIAMPAIAQSGAAADTTTDRKSVV